LNLPFKLLAYVASASLLLASLAPLLSIAWDLASLGPRVVEVSVEAAVEPEGYARVALTVAYRGGTPIEGFTVRVRAHCGGAPCAEATGQPTRLARGAASAVEVRIPLSADSLEIEAWGLVGGLYRFVVRREVRLAAP